MSKNSEHGASVCDDPRCGCHHDHHHEHDHHEHHHQEASVSQASNIINNSMVMSRNWGIRTITPVTCAVVEERFRKGFLEIGDLLAVDGAILGHLKGTVKVQSGAFLMFSLTRQGEIDITRSTNWETLESTSSLNVIINILSVQKVSLSLEQFFDFSDY